MFFSEPEPTSGADIDTLAERAYSDVTNNLVNVVFMAGICNLLSLKTSFACRYREVIQEQMTLTDLKDSILYITFKLMDMGAQVIWCTIPPAHISIYPGTTILN
jgi:hypothetical protein